MSQKPSKRQRFKNFILRRKLNVLGLLVITVMSALITLVCAIRGFVYTDILFIVSLLLVALCFVQSIKLKRASAPFRSISRLPAAAIFMRKTTWNGRKRDCPQSFLFLWINRIIFQK